MNVVQGTDFRPKKTKCLTSHCKQSVSYPGEVCGLCTSFARQMKVCSGNKWPLILTLLMALVIYSIFGLFQ